jgi:hypothetical protein
MATDDYISSFRISTVGKIKAFPIEVSEQRMLKFEKHTGFMYALNTIPNKAFWSDCFKIRGIFIPTHLVEDVVMVIEIGGNPQFTMPLKLLALLNNRTDIPNYISFNHDTFFNDFIYTNHLTQYHEIRIIFTNVPDDIKSIDVLFDTMLLETQPLMKREYKKTTRIKCVTDDKPGRILQNILVCENKANIKSVHFKVRILKGSEEHTVFNYNEHLVSIYGVEVNENVTCFSMNPLLPWTSHESNSGFHTPGCDVEVVVETNIGNEKPKIYYLSANMLTYSPRHLGVHLLWRSFFNLFTQLEHKCGCSN